MNLKGYVMVRAEMRDGTAKWELLRPDVLREGNHYLMCRAFGLDEIITWFDLPRSFSTVEAGGLGPGRREISGYIFQGPKGSEPVGKLTVAYEGERFREEDSDQGGYLRLGRR